MPDLDEAKKRILWEPRAILTWLCRHSRACLWAGFGAHVLLFSVLSFLQYHYFLYRDWDLALYNQLFSGFLAGRPFMSMADLPYLGLHAELTMLVFLPFYAVAPHPLTLLVLQSVALAAAIFPLFRIARLVINEAMALFFCAVYLSYPALGYVNLNEFHPECLLPLIQFSLFYFFLRRNWGMFLLFMALCLFAKENMPLIVIMFGVLAAVQKRPLRWVLGPVIAGLAWFVVFMKWIFPALSDGQIHFGFLYKHMGDSLPAIIGFMVTHPVSVFVWLAQGRCLAYVFALFFPLAFTPLFGPGILLLALPNLLQHLLSLRLSETSIMYYYSAEFMAFIFIAGIFGLKRVWNFLSQRERRLFRIVLIVCVFGAALLSPQVTSLLTLARGFGGNDVRARSYRTLIRAVPPDAGVVATFSFLPELSRGPARLDSFHKVLTGHNYPGRPFVLSGTSSYALVDFNDPKAFGDFFVEQENRDNLKKFFADGGWGAELALGDAVVFKRGARRPPLLTKTVFSGEAQEPAFIFDDELVLQKIKKDFFTVNGQEGVRAVFSWRLLRPTAVQYGLGLVLVNGASQVAWKDIHPIGYRVYPTTEWGVGEMIEETYAFLLPRRLGPGPWQVCLVPVDSTTGAQTRVSGGAITGSGDAVACFSL